MTRILIVDDQSVSRCILRALLTRHNCHVDEAQHGAEALVKARQSPPDLIISDLLMPVMDGYTLLRQWKADAQLKKIPFIVYTATYTDARDEKLARDLDADAFILKPAKPELFVKQILEIFSQTPRPPVVPPVKAEGPARLPIHAPEEEEIGELRQYNTVLIRKLEQKVEQLEKAQRNLAQREARLRLVIESEPECVKIVSPEGRLLEMNGAGLAMIGCDSLIQAQARPLIEWVTDKHRAGFGRLHKEVMAGGRGIYEFEVIGRSGTRRWLETHAAPLPDANGQVTAMLGITRDITERKLAEESMRELSARLLRAQDEERRRIARELHDNTAQQLAALSMNLVSLQKSVAPESPMPNRRSPTVWP